MCKYNEYLDVYVVDILQHHLHNIDIHYVSGSTPYYNAFFGQGTGPIFLDDLLCNGRETRLINCPRLTSTGIGNVDFCRGHQDDAGVRCVQRK